MDERLRGRTVSLANSFPSIVMELFRYGQARDEARAFPSRRESLALTRRSPDLWPIGREGGPMNLAGFNGGHPAAAAAVAYCAQVEEDAPGLIEGGAFLP